MLVNVFDQLGLGIGRPGDQNRAGVSDRMRNRLEKILILGGVSRADGIGLVVDVPGRIVRTHHQPFDVGRVEVEYAGFVMIDPNDSMKVMGCHETRSLIFAAGSAHLTRTDFAIKTW